ncbi:phage tail protein [Natrinema sp. H-ect1]|uniref:phage tail protein n=1 Tax=Natrinema sp. H-ect1 TaxID=3242700 RepID=UPI00359EDAA2
MESRERLLKRTDRTVQDPCAICASANRVFVCDAADGTITALTPQLHRVVGTLRAGLTEPRALAYADGTIYALTASGLVAVDRNGTTTSLFDDQLTAPRDFAVRENTIYVLDDDTSGPSLRTFGDRAVDDSDTAADRDRRIEFRTKPFTPACVTALGDDAVVSGAIDDTDEYGVFVYDAATETFEQRVQLDARPLRMVAQSGDPETKTLHVVTDDERACHGFRARTEYVNHSRRNRHLGTAILRFDSGATAIDWHRLVLDIVRTSASTQVRVRYTATDDPTVLAFEPELLEDMVSDDAAAIRDMGIESMWEFATATPASLVPSDASFDQTDVESWQEQASTELAVHAASEWTTSDVIDPEDILVENASGRYLYVAVELLGTPDASPVLDSVRAYCPRTSYLRHMPELYREDQESAEFLERFLSVMESSFVDVEAEFDSVGELLDPYGVSSKSLAWLESWLAADTGREWPESARRELLARAPELYKKRGTKAGLLELIRLYLRHTEPEGSTPGSQETTDTPSGATDNGGTPDYRLFFVERTDTESVDADTVQRHYGSFLSGSRSFAVFCGPLGSDERLATLQEIIDAERPAHVNGTVVELEDAFSLGESSFLGLNSHLTSREFSMGDARLGEDTVLTPRSPEESTSGS